jgi:N-acetyl-anhydromuramyl-L-alanine amidase AmpD
VVDVKDYHHISQTYDVRVQDYRNEAGTPIVLRSCKRAVGQASFDGVGEYTPLEEGDPVLLMCVNGKLEDAVIIGSTYTLGDYNTFLREGQADEPFHVYDSFNGNKTAAQPSVHPSRMAQPDSYVRLIGSKNFHTPFDDPRFHEGREDQRAASPQLGSLEIRNKVGDVVNYSTGSQVYYSDADILILTNASGISRCTRLNNMAAYYVSMVEKIEKYLGINKGSNSERDESVEEIRPASTELPTTLQGQTNSLILTEIDSNRTDINSIDFNEWSPTQYHLEQAQKLAKAYREAASSCIEGSLMNNAVATAMQEPSDANEEEIEDYVDAEVTEATVPECNYGRGLDSSKERIFVIHETGVTSKQALDAVTGVGRGVSYHGIIYRDGSVVKLVSHSNTAYAAGESSFDGESSNWKSSSSSSLSNVIRLAASEVGYSESPPGSNKTKYGAWYGMDGVPWCAIFVSYCFYLAGSKLPPITTEKGFAYCPAGVSYYKERGQLDMNPRPGDIVFFDWQKDGTSDHVGIVESIASSNSVICIEGNTSNSDNSNGGQVMRRTRNFSQIAGFAHPSASSESCPERNINSVDSFAIQYSLESGDGYTKAQYKTLAQILKSTGIKADRVTSHHNVSNGKTDPKNFSCDAFNRALSSVGYMGGRVNFKVSGSPIEPEE